ncbi:MFS transporter [Buttiauxella selenatireducens]|uniref:MFS transporter n=1 Tax=Buttiauxella selenatireducens TaxID=3073902 RepID=A0ABY9S506_9ENTR|nr:MFS transporter [Buttiauxella sp. R73]WMY72586.1 MFS transporter [Buttiauxella sp. R73]
MATEHTVIVTGSRSVSHGALIVILLAQLILVVDGTVVYMALPSIAMELDFPTTTLSWVLNAYMLTFGGLMLLGGCAGSHLGHKRIFITANMLFIAASCAAGIAGTPLWLIITRGLQGIAAAFAAPSAFALLMILFAQKHSRERALRLYTAVSGVGSAAGLVLGGILTSYFSWRYVFFINLPIGVLLLMGGIHYLPTDKQKSGKRLDIAGALTCTTGMFLLVYGLIQAAEKNPGYAGNSVIAALLILALFVIIEKRSQDPVLPLSLFSNSLRTGAYLSKFMMIGGMLGTFFFLTQYCQTQLGYSALETALLFLPLSLSQLIMVVYGCPRLLRALGPRKLLLCGFSLAIAGMLWLCLVATDSLQIIDLLPAVILLGMGSGAALVPLAILGTSDITSSEVGAASGVVNATHYLGGAVGTAVIICVADFVLPSILDMQGSSSNQMVISAVCSMLFFACSILLTLFTMRD